ncbi:MAG: hypothetical protein LBD21_09010 [Tannerellaceae bacterium]|jgi:hypothetical protein|nr:hypothetical protein [Tannerellaceae bacterium]
MKRFNLIKHFTITVILTALLALGMAYPFLSGRFDRLALPISIMIQVFGIAGLSLVPVGVLWLAMPKLRFVFAITTVIVSSFVALVMALFAALSVGYSFGILTLLLWLFVVSLLIPQIKSLKERTGQRANWQAFYLICLPIFTLSIQLALAKHLREFSRNRAIENASTFISDIENYHAQQGHYPLSLQAQNKDYDPAVGGSEKYMYAPHKNAYNLSFEQPRFLLDDFGAREWVVYNPLDENASYSHTHWRLNTNQPEIGQGWYASESTGHKHWKYFLFD